MDPSINYYYHVYKDISISQRKMATNIDTNRSKIVYSLNEYKTISIEKYMFDKNWQEEHAQINSNDLSPCKAF